MSDTLGTIAAALERLRQAYLANDADAIEAATRELEELGQAQLAIAGVDERKRRAVTRLAGVWRWQLIGEYGESTYRGFIRSKWLIDDIAYAVALPVTLVALLVDGLQAKSDANEAGAARGYEERVTAEDAWKAALRRAVLASPCPTCGASPGERCVALGAKVAGKKKGTPHADRARCACGHTADEHRDRLGCRGRVFNARSGRYTCGCCDFRPSTATPATETVTRDESAGLAAEVTASTTRV